MTKPYKQPQDFYHPAIQNGVATGWHYPMDVPEEYHSEPWYEKAVENHWLEWVSSPDDIDALRNGYAPDFSFDKSGNIITFYDGQWHDLKGKPIKGKERDFVKYVGAVDRMIRFCEMFIKFSKPPLTGQPYRFIPWQRFLCNQLFGWVTTDPQNEAGVKYRRYRFCYLSIAKKNAKSALASAIALYYLICEGPRMQGYGCATDRSQARIVYDELAAYARASDVLADMLDIADSRSTVRYKEEESFYRVISSESSHADGIDASIIIFDELHRQKSRDLWDVLKRSQMARRQPLFMVTTTCGSNLSSVWYQDVHKPAVDHLAGHKTDWKKLVYFSSADKVDVRVIKDCEPGATVIPVYRLQQPVYAPQEVYVGTSRVVITEEAPRFAWHLNVEPIKNFIKAGTTFQVNEEWQSDHGIARANPSVGITFDRSVVWDEIRDATTASGVAQVKQLNFNMIGYSIDTWIPPHAWEISERKIYPEDFHDRRCYGGLDLSFTSDRTAFWLAFPSWGPYAKYGDDPANKVTLMGMTWVPESRLDERSRVDGIPYGELASQPYYGEMGVVRVCPGETIDYSMVGKDILALAEMFNIVCILYDPAYSDFVVKPYLEKRLRCIVQRQGMLSMAPITKAFESGVKSGRVEHDGNMLLTSCIGSAALRHDTSGNSMVCKKKSTSKIDELVAAIMAHGAAVHPPVASSRAWSTDDARSF